MFLTVIIFIFTLLILVLVHEFGHFIMAKKFKVRVEEFGFGLPPKIIGRKIGETLVSLNALPIGGFVRLFGEDETDTKIIKDKHSFASKPVTQRIAIVIFGVIMNLLLAVILFWIILFAKGFKEQVPLYLPYQFFGADQVNQTVILVGDVAKKSPAEKVGIVSGDRITKVNDILLSNADELVNIINKNAGEMITLTVIDHEDEIKQIEAVPRTSPPIGEGPLGIGLGTVTIADLTYATPFQKAASGFTHSYNFVVYSFKIFGSLIDNAIKSGSYGPVSETVSGPIGITQLANGVLQTKSPVLPYLNLIALLSLNLAVINIFPFPALDGGRLLFLLIELIRRKRVNPSFEKRVHMVGMVILLSLIFLITISDIRKLFS
jgi:regulator of sigma E protease